ncbi:hypothetical protein IFM46972_04242 [Aspergillus udagawae]|uniref:Uncharacterized protein n=1 Tax=Aspergillus udagawae TaxID=91492 RepID=A0A8H3RQZ7_9EURO|nr:hypothetical protein IFM46972_04242 [Aspergillus udagawae]
MQTAEEQGFDSIFLQKNSANIVELWGWIFRTWKHPLCCLRHDDLPVVLFREELDSANMAQLGQSKYSRKKPHSHAAAALSSQAVRFHRSVVEHFGT